MIEYKNFINGRWILSESQKTTPNLNPSDTSDVIGILRNSTGDEVKEAIRSAREAFKRWRFVPAPESGRLIDRARQLLQKRKEEVAKMLTREEGKTLAEAMGEVQKSINILEFMAGEAMRIAGETLPSELPATFCYTIRQPVGVVAIITPWNFPIAIPCWKIAPALIAGCSVVFKPASLTPHTAMLLVEIFQEAGVPEGVLNLIYGSGGEVGDALVAHPDINAISFTGSNEVGMEVYKRGATYGKKIQCEMGGKNPVVVLEDADLELAVDGTIQGAFGSTGQRCTATSRAIVIDSVADKFVDMLVAQTSRIIVGNGMDEKTTMGPVVDKYQLEKVLEYIEIGKQEGAKLVYGGRQLTDGDYRRGYFVEPTIFDYVKPNMKIAQDEIFGPVLSVIRVKSFGEAVEVANGVRYGLTSSIYSSDPQKIFRFIELIETGITHVNSPTVGGEAQLPFGGIKQTGVGAREMGSTAIDFYTEIKTVYLDYSHKKRQVKIY